MSCEACRQHHYKCDDAWPSCSRCARVGRRCVKKETYRFRHSGLVASSFPQARQSPPPPQQEIVFVDGNANPEGGGRPREDSPSVLDEQLYPVVQDDALVGRDGGAARESVNSAASLSWPVGSEQEAFLIRHFVSKVSHFFDFCDPARHFARVVPQKARSNGTLANAVLALSARHLSRTTTFDAYVADMYYQRCLQQLIPALDNNAQDESLLVAAVILRLMEEIDVPITGADSQNHLIGTQAIAHAQEQDLLNSNSTSGLLQAAHWAALRQDLYIAFATHRPLLLSSLEFFRAFHVSEKSESLKGDDEDSHWASLAVLQCCDVTQYVFGPSSKDPREHEQLKLTNIGWQQNRPASFEPFYRRQSVASSRIPDIRFLTDWHVMGHMYNLLTRVLLGTNDSLDISSDLSGGIETTLCEMMGICLHNPDTPSAHLVASMALAMCGKCLTANSEITFMKKILTDTEKIHGWPTGAARQSLGD